MEDLNIVNMHCPNCGAPVTSEVCPYCHVATGIKAGAADMEYPVIECKEANIGFWNVTFPMIFAVSFGFAGGFAGILFHEISNNFQIIGMLNVFAIIGIVALVIALKPIINYLKIKNNGKEIEGTVYGYLDDKILLNGTPAQIVKILVNTSEGPRFILYQLMSTEHPYKVNGTIKLKAYKDVFIILKDKKYYF